jgi:hypothetical protein
MQRTSWMEDGRPIKVNAVYFVSGCTYDLRFPYVNNIQSLKEAVTIAKTYQGTGTAVGAGRVQRYLRVYYPEDCDERHLTWMTHEWYVHEEGILEHTGWGRGRDRQIYSPAKRLAEAIRDQQAEEALMNAAANRDPSGLTVDDFDTITQIMLGSLTRSARSCGFRCVYFATPEKREYLQKRWIEGINWDLAHAGFRTLDQDRIGKVLRDNIYSFEHDLATGVLRIAGRIAAEAHQGDGGARRAPQWVTDLFAADSDIEQVAVSRPGGASQIFTRKRVSHGED